MISFFIFSKVELIWRFYLVLFWSLMFREAMSPLEIQKKGEDNGIPILFLGLSKIEGDHKLYLFSQQKKGYHVFLE